MEQQQQYSLDIAAINIRAFSGATLSHIPDELVKKRGFISGATVYQIIQYILVPEALPGLVRGIGIMLINLVGLFSDGWSDWGEDCGPFACPYGYQQQKV